MFTRSLALSLELPCPVYVVYHIIKHMHAHNNEILYIIEREDRYNRMTDGRYKISIDITCVGLASACPGSISGKYMWAMQFDAGQAL